MKEYISYLEAAQTIGISESTFRRRLKNIPLSSLSKLTKSERGKVFIHSSILSILSNNEIVYSLEKIEKSSSEIEYLRSQNNNLLDRIQDKDKQIQDLTSLVVKLQNDINGYIKQLQEGRKEDEGMIDKVVKIVLVVAILGLAAYLIFG